MKKLILWILIILNPCGVLISNKWLSELDEFPNKKNIKEDDIILEEYFSHSNKLDSILGDITKNIQGINHCSTELLDLCYYITFRRCDQNDLYLQITQDYTNRYLFIIKDKLASSFKDNSERIWGYYKYRNIHFYILSSPYPCMPTENDIHIFFTEKEEKVIINKMPEEYYYMSQNPVWLYQYNDGKLFLRKSIDGKGIVEYP